MPVIEGDVLVVKPPITKNRSKMEGKQEGEEVKPYTPSVNLIKVVSKKRRKNTRKARAISSSSQLTRIENKEEREISNSGKNTKESGKDNSIESITI